MKPRIQQRKKRIEAEIVKLIENGQLPAAHFEKHVADALKDESLLKQWRARNQELRGHPPLNLPPARVMDQQEREYHDAATSKAFEKFFPDDWWNNSFFDDGVQNVMNEIRGECEHDMQKADLIQAWKVCDNAVLCGMRDQNGEKLIDFLRGCGSWGARLLAAVQFYYETTARQEREPKTLADLFRKWANWRYMESSSLLRPKDPPAAYSHAVAEIHAAAKPVIRQNNLSVTDGALRKHVCDENAKRERIMQHWKQYLEAHNLLISSMLSHRYEKLKIS